MLCLTPALPCPALPGTLRIHALPVPSPARPAACWGQPDPTRTLREGASRGRDGEEGSRRGGARSALLRLSPCPTGLPMAAMGRREARSIARCPGMRFTPLSHQQRSGVCREQRGPWGDRQGVYGSSRALLGTAPASVQVSPCTHRASCSGQRGWGGAAGSQQPGAEGLAAPQAGPSVLPVGNSPFTMAERLLHPSLAPARSR